MPTDTELLDGLEKLGGPWLCRHTYLDCKNDVELHQMRSNKDDEWFAGIDKSGQAIDRKPLPTAREAIAAFLEAEQNRPA